MQTEAKFCFPLLNFVLSYCSAAPTLPLTSSLSPFIADLLQEIHEPASSNAIS